MKRVILASISAALLLQGCNDSKDDPDTVKRSNLNPPSDLHAVHGSKQIELRWRSQNLEKDLKGYYVFGANSSWDELRSLILYPKVAASDWRLSQGVPRCKDNNEFFARFGLPPTNAACEVKGVLSLLNGGSDNDETAASIQDAALDCGKDSTQLSLSAVAPQTTIQRCNVSKIFDGNRKVDFVDGVSSTFFVVAVQGDSLSDISWTSNFVEGAGSIEVFAGEVELSSLSHYRTLRIDPDTLAATLSEEQPCGNHRNPNNFCRVANVNDETVDAPSLFLAGDNWRAYASGQKLRAFFSVPKGPHAMVMVQARGPQTSDELVPGVQARVPRGAPLTGVRYLSDGKVHSLYGNQVFDLFITSDHGKHYGKLVIQSVSYSTQDPLTTNAKMSVSVIVQPGQEVPHYIMGHQG